MGYGKSRIRITGKGVNTKGMDKQKKESVKTSQLRCGRRTYFFDVNVASNKTKYLKITESRFVEEGQDRKRNTFILFPEDVRNFQERFEEIKGYLTQ